MKTIILFILIALTTCFSFNSALATDYKTISKESATIVNEHGINKQIINNSSTTNYFVPTKTAAEYQSFIDHLPSDVIVQDASSMVYTWQFATKACQYRAFDPTYATDCVITHDGVIGAGCSVAGQKCNIKSLYGDPVCTSTLNNRDGTSITLTNKGYVGFICQ